MNIDDKIREIAAHATTNGGYERLCITIECPLPSGIRVYGTKVCHGKEERVALTGGMRPFFLFVKEEKEKRTEPFNVVEITVSANGRARYIYHFDQVLQHRAEEDVK